MRCRSSFESTFVPKRELGNKLQIFRASPEGAFTDGEIRAVSASERRRNPSRERKRAEVPAPAQDVPGQVAGAPRSDATGSSEGGGRRIARRESMPPLGGARILCHVSQTFVLLETSEQTCYAGPSCQVRFP